jgi:uncharacterized protein YpmB
MKGNKVNSTIAVFIIILLSVAAAFIFLREEEPVSDTLRYAPDTIQKLNDLNRTLSSTSPQAAP